jgi:DNA-binding MurR/RpiR family transcriptional regulator
MHASLDVNTEEKLLEAVTLLRHARRVIITGIGASGLVARNFSWKLMKIGINAVSEQDMHALLATVQAMSRTICCWPSPTPANDARSIWRPVKRCA